MNPSIGIVVTEHIASALVDGDHVIGEVRRRTEDQDNELLRGMPAGELVRLIAAEAADLCAGRPLEAIGLAFPGMIRGGVTEDSPNLQQLKGHRMQAGMTEALRAHHIEAPVTVSNDADVAAAGI